jgi:hypothetical protein
MAEMLDLVRTAVDQAPDRSGNSLGAERAANRIP